MTRNWLVAAAALSAMTGCLPLTSVPSPHGSQVRVQVQDKTLRGELLAVSAESLWVANPKGGVAGPTALALADVQRLVVQRGTGTGPIAMRGVLYGLGTGLAMFAACNSVSDATGCGGVFVFSAAVPSGLALIAGSGMSAKRQRAFVSVTADSLARYARWPQGLPTARPK